MNEWKRSHASDAESLDIGGHSNSSGSVTCLGRTFENEDARREHFIEVLRERLEDEEFRSQPGFPQGEIEAILDMSDPPYYTACPNPFLDDFISCNGKVYDPNEPYSREPLAVDASVGKTDQLYKAHSYHTKVPHLAIVPLILRYTDPGDTVLDGFCGSGMTGVAAQYCGTAPSKYRSELEAQWKEEGLDPPVWGLRRAILSDIGPAATFIAAGYNLPFDVAVFESAATSMLDDLKDELGWMYETRHVDGTGSETRGRINYTVWSEILSCPECGGEINFVDETLIPETQKTRALFPCPNCDAELDKRRLERIFDTLTDPVSGKPWERVKFRPVRINYNVGSARYEKEVTDDDRELLQRIERLECPRDLPTHELPLGTMYHGTRLGPKGFTWTHHLYLPRPMQALASLWRRARSARDSNDRRILTWLAEQTIWEMSILNIFRPTGFSQVGQYLNGVYYVASQVSELSPWYILFDRRKRNNKLKRVVKAFTPPPSREGSVIVSTSDCSSLGIRPNSIDYIFTDPPFGSNIYYADLNQLVESWHGVRTDSGTEAIVDHKKGKGPDEYQGLMRKCFKMYHRALKPGRWITVVFSNSSNAIWRAIQEAIGTAGFVVADVRILDKESGSFRQLTSSAVKQDLIISAYKPSEDLSERFALGKVDEDSAWAFVSEHLRSVPVFVGGTGPTEVVLERTPRMLMDRMIAFHVQRGLEVPIGSADFLVGLENRFPERDGMFFLADQVAEYDRKRLGGREPDQPGLFVTDEASAIQWIRQQLMVKPRSFQELHPAYMKEAQQSWAEHEQTIDLRVMLEQNFLCYDGTGSVPSQIHAYVSSNFKNLRNRGKEDSELRAKARNRWYVADPGKQADLEKLREKSLLREFEAYEADEGSRLARFRTEAIRTGFKASYDARDYRRIVRFAKRVPVSVLQEDEKLLMYYDVASMRLGEDS